MKAATRGEIRKRKPLSLVGILSETVASAEPLPWAIEDTKCSVKIVGNGHAIAWVTKRPTCFAAENARLIVAAVNGIPKLIDELASRGRDIECLTSEVETLKSMIEELQRTMHENGLEQTIFLE